LVRLKKIKRQKNGVFLGGDRGVVKILSDIFLDISAAKKLKHC